MKRLILAAAILAVTSCVQYDVDEILLIRDDISLTVKGVEQFAYNPLTCQISNNVTTHEYRIHDDKLSCWVIMKCDDRPMNEGQEVRADLSWTAEKSTKNLNGLTFTVEKTAADGKIWLWCRKKSIGIVIKNL